MTTDPLRFSRARNLVLNDGGGGDGIGRLSEKSLHRILKYYIEPNEEYHEVKCSGSIADIMRDGEIFEIQTRNTEKLNSKLESFLKDFSVTVVLPFAAKKSVSWLDPISGEISSPRNSPKKETVFDAIFELSRIKAHIENKNLKIKLIFLDVSEYRYLNGFDKTRKRGSTRCERLPNSITEEYDIIGKEGIASVLPRELNGEFSARDLAALTKRTSRKNHYILHFLIDLGIVSFVRKEGKKHIYKANAN